MAKTGDDSKAHWYFRWYEVLIISFFMLLIGYIVHDCPDFKEQCLKHLSPRICNELLDGGE